jgi:hypothetical protein
MPFNSAVNAMKQPTIPMIGLLASLSSTYVAQLRLRFVKLERNGYVDGRSVSVEFRSAKGNMSA